MKGVTGTDAETLAIQIKSLVIFEFLDAYNEFEKLIRLVFENHLDTFPAKVLQKLYFCYGGKIGTYIEYDDPTIKLTTLTYKENEKFKELTINQIIKFFKETKYIESFNFSIPSFQRTTVVFTFYDCAIRLLNMRNKLAHEMVTLSFKQSDLIELLPFEQLERESFSILQNFDLRKMDGMTQYIASNVVFMRKLIGKLSSDTKINS